MRTITKEFSFSYGHRLRFHSGLCKNLHGHNAILRITLGETSMNKDDMVIDFSVVKNKVKEWLDKNWEHAMIVAKEDTELGELLIQLPNQKIFILDNEPTAENMAGLLFKSILPTIFAGLPVTIYSVVFYETPTSYTEIKV